MPFVDVSALCELLLTTETTDELVKTLRTYAGFVGDMPHFLMSTKVVRAKDHTTSRMATPRVFAVDDTVSDETIDALNETYFADTDVSRTLRKKLLDKYTSVLSHFFKLEVMNKYTYKAMDNAFTSLKNFTSDHSTHFTEATHESEV